MNEQENFYHEANEFIDRNCTELQLGEAYAKFSFSRAIWTCAPGQLVLVLAILGLVYGERGILFHKTTRILFLEVLAQPQVERTARDVAQGG